MTNRAFNKSDKKFYDLENSENWRSLHNRKRKHRNYEGRSGQVSFGRFGRGKRKTHAKFQFDDEAVIVPLVSLTGHGHRSMKRIFFQSGKFCIRSILCAVIPKDKTQLSAEFLFRYLDYNKKKNWFQE